ncbi:LacI family DNA-binding transcriptional regulator [Deinococcus sp. JMULE3]|uniref:LacI family DNA-binding transcriptional regulator n=1 Tax=Deinococcus sp. JMULE3 TaxID=2518341 RepID=UPI0015777563|nr:LacI family DNA-binding transcriptional regulator [Deinococcus sp. JMULE3]NTY01009.1 LacI family DNA-binding transcriptional regulator [Deinococcus sp. JMULE3]
MTRNVTIRDIAREAGVSISTVSRALNGQVPVAPDKLQRVLDATRRLRYEPNAAAQGLVRGRSMTVGVLTQDIASPFYSEVSRGIDAALAGSGYQPIFVNGHWAVQDEAAAITALTRRQVDALIVLGGRLSDGHLRDLHARLPLVVVGRRVPGLEAACLSVDNVQGAFLATTHLIQLGHRRIGHITGEQSQRDALDRLDGYRRALAAAGVPFDPALVFEGDFHEGSGILAVEHWLARATAFSAIFAANDQMAYGAGLGLYRRGLRVPEDVSLVGFDDLPGSQFTLPPLTSVHHPAREMGELAARHLLTHLNDPAAPAGLPGLDITLSVRESVRAARP